ncbi:MAG: helix-turn-helix domain-containing protein [Gammaproteobacteria bacterium]|nr:helix-turn-helix domain-containing protein [Gammaproteobacteria bacterium]
MQEDGVLKVTVINPASKAPVRELTSEVEAILAEMMADEQHGPGPYLRRLREMQGLSLYQTSTGVSVGEPQIRALENDEFENLPAPIFVRHFLQRYCNFLNIPADEVMESYERIGVIETPSLARVSIRPKLGNRRISLHWAVFSLVALVMAVFIYWWQTRPLEPEVFQFGPKKSEAQPKPEQKDNSLALPPLNFTPPAEDVGAQ